VARHEVVAIHDEPNEPMVDDRDGATRVIRNREAAEENVGSVMRRNPARKLQRA